MEEKGESISIYVAGNIAAIWTSAAKSKGQSVSRWGAQAIEERLEREQLLPHQRTQKEELMDLAAQAADKDFGTAKAVLTELLRGELTSVG